ncbi:MAG: hypothetical protein GEU89_09750 [Kiloniellaceae bacterium]|nr:hypothetical protein [Kiloniellaceae bacterium]
MTRNEWFITTSRFTLAAVLAAGMAAAPIGFGGIATAPNSAVAQTTDDATVAQSDDDSDAEGAESAESSDVESDDSEAAASATGEEAPNGEASEFVGDPDAEVGTPNLAAVDTGSTQFQYYAEAAERDDLDAAAEALADATGEPITPELVEHVNEELDVQTSLRSSQIVAAANAEEKEGLPY